MCGRVSVSKLCMDKLCCMFVCMYVCTYVRAYVWMYGWVDGWMDVYMYVFMYLCVYGRSASTLIFSTSGAVAWA